jgi:hypothetical protein
VGIYIVQYTRCRITVGKSIDGRVKIEEAIRRSVAIEARKCYSRLAFIASDFSSRVQSRDISRFGMKKQAHRVARQELHPEKTSSKQPSGNWK